MDWGPTWIYPCSSLSHNLLDSYLELTVSKNPPSIPSLAIVQLVGHIRGSKVIIDWHNLGYSILALKLGQNHLIVRMAKWWDLFLRICIFASTFIKVWIYIRLSSIRPLVCYQNYAWFSCKQLALTVRYRTQVSSEQELIFPWIKRSRQAILYDRPPRHFHRSSTQEIHEVDPYLQKCKLSLKPRLGIPKITTILGIKKNSAKFSA